MAFNPFTGLFEGPTTAQAFGQPGQFGQFPNQFPGLSSGMGQVQMLDRESIIQYLQQLLSGGGLSVDTLPGGVQRIQNNLGLAPFQNQPAQNPPNPFLNPVAAPQPASDPLSNLLALMQLRQARDQQTQAQPPTRSNVNLQPVANEQPIINIAQPPAIARPVQQPAQPLPTRQPQSVGGFAGSIRREAQPRPSNSLVGYLDPRRRGGIV